MGVRILIFLNSAFYELRFMIHIITSFLIRFHLFRYLARISHKLTTAAADISVLTALCSFSLPSVAY